MKKTFIWCGALLLVSIAAVGCQREAEVEEQPVEDPVYFNQIAKCNEKEFPAADVSVSPEENLRFEIIFESKVEDEIVYTVALVRKDDDVIMNSCSGSVTKTGGKYAIRCEMAAPPKARADCVVRVLDGDRQVIFKGDLPVVKS